MPRVHLPDGSIVNFPDSMSEDDITTAMQGLTAPRADEKPEGRSVGGFLSNVASSGGKFLTDTVQGIPALAGMVAKTVRASVDPDYRTQVATEIGESAPRVLSAAGKGLKTRYGGIEQIKNTLYTDPVGVLSDISTVAMPAEAGLKAGGFAKLAKAAGAVGEFTNPLKAVGAVAEPLAHGAANAAVRGTLRPPAAVRGDFGGSKAVADAVLKDRVFSEASAGRKLDRSVANADTMLADAEAAGVPGVGRRDVANAVVGGPKDTAKLRTRLGVADQTPELMDTAKGILRNNPKKIALTDAQKMKREAQSLAYEAGADNQTVKKAAEIAKAKALRGGIESRVPEVGPVNEQSQRLLGSKLAFGAAEDRPRALTNFLSALGGVGGFAGGGPVGAVGVPMLMKAMDSPRFGAMAGIGMDRAGKAMNSAELMKAALLARLLGQDVPE